MRAPFSFIKSSGAASPTTVESIAPSWGSEDGGTTVWIKVANSAGATGATVGGVALTSFAIADATHVRGVTGAATGLGDVVVTNAGGASSPLVDGYFHFDPTDANYAPSASYIAPEYDDGGASWGEWTPRTGYALSSGADPRPVATGGGATFDGAATIAARDSAHPASTWYGIGRRHVAVVIDLASIANDDTANTYGNAAIYVDSNADMGLTIYRTGAGPYTYLASVFERDAGGLESATLDITSLVDASGAGTLVLEAKKDDSGGTDKLQIRANNGTWTVGTACGDLTSTTGYLLVGRGYGGSRIDGTIRALAITGTVQDGTYSTNLQEWATRLPSGWVRRETGGMPTAPDNFLTRSATMQFTLASGRLLLVGGFNTTADPEWDGIWVTNEVWASDDEGETWSKLLAHVTDPPTSGAGARFRPCHSVAHCVWNGVAVIAGIDPTFQTTGDGDVWVSNSTGDVWTRVTTTAPCLGRTMHMMGCIGSTMYLMGGQGDTLDAATALADVWSSTDGGANWTELAAPPWSARGMMFCIPTLDGKLYLTGGSVYDNVAIVAYNGVYSFDGTTWVEILPDGHTQFTAYPYRVPCVLHGRIWLFNGYNVGATIALYETIYSDDKGATWSTFAGGAGGGASTADFAMATTNYVVRVPGLSTGSESARPIYRFALEGNP